MKINLRELAALVPHFDQMAFMRELMSDGDGVRLINRYIKDTLIKLFSTTSVSTWYNDPSSDGRDFVESFIGAIEKPLTVGKRKSEKAFSDFTRQTFDMPVDVIVTYLSLLGLAPYFDGISVTSFGKTEKLNTVYNNAMYDENAEYNVQEERRIFAKRQVYSIEGLDFHQIEQELTGWIDTYLDLFEYGELKFRGFEFYGMMSVDGYSTNASNKATVKDQEKFFKKLQKVQGSRLKVSVSAHLIVHQVFTSDVSTNVNLKAAQLQLALNLISQIRRETKKASSQELEKISDNLVKMIQDIRS